MIADKVIWNDDRTMNFLASKYRAAYIYKPSVGSGAQYRVRVQIADTRPKESGSWSGLYYADCDSAEEAKASLARLTAKLISAGVIEATENSKVNRFDNVELQEKDDENREE